MLGQSVPMRQLMSLIERVASADVPVLITGESGTGKEVTAQLIHKLSSRRDGPYVAVNCAAIPEPLIESHLFGHEKGAFTGADRRQQGFFESANGGTILLDKLRRCDAKRRPSFCAPLRRRVLPVGSTKEIPISARVLAASNRPIGRAIRDGHLREDLYYRLKVCSLHLPPLRERLED